MLYRLKLYLLKAQARHRPRCRLARRLRGYVRKLLRASSATAFRGDYRVDLIRKHAPGKSFADIGCMWGVNGRFSFLAEEGGASSVVAVDIYPPSDGFLETKKRKKSKIRFVQGDVGRREIVEEIGKCEVVFCSGVLYHHPSPLHLLLQLSSICTDTLILGTKTVPEIGGLRNTAVFYPYLSERQRRLWSLGIGRQRAITVPYVPDSGYGNWLWGLSTSCVESLLCCAGFDVEERRVRAFDSWFLCRAAEKRVLEVSGPWSVPTGRNLPA